MCVLVGSEEYVLRIEFFDSFFELVEDVMFFVCKVVGERILFLYNILNFI